MEHNRILLLKAAANTYQNDIKWGWEMVATALSKEYASDLKIMHCHYHATQALFEAIADKRYEISDRQINELLTAPSKYPYSGGKSFFSALDEPSTLRNFYDAQIRFCLSQLQLCRVDWCSEAYKKIVNTLPLAISDII